MNNALAGLLVSLVFAVGGITGYVLNVVDLFELNFEAPYKAEICRGMGVIFPPIGAIEGLFVTFDKEKANAEKR